MPVGTTNTSHMYRNALTTESLTLCPHNHCCSEGTAQQGKSVLCGTARTKSFAFGSASG